MKDNLLGMSCSSLGLAEAQREVFRLKIEASGGLGWSPRIRQRFGYFTPDEWYEAVLYRLVNSNTEWLDVGCGRSLFPSNPNLGSVLASRCKLLVGVDPDKNIDENSLLHERQQCLINDYNTDREFDLISLRMVAEHISDPSATTSVLRRLTRIGGKVVIYTVSKWSVSSLVAAMTPMAFHHAAKALLWRSSPEDTFPTLYRMNTRKKLWDIFKSAGFVEESFQYLDDCRSLARWYLPTILELSVERLLSAVGLRYPEICILGIYRKEL